MESYSSDAAFPHVTVFNNTTGKPHKNRNRCSNLCGQSCSQMHLTAREKAKKYFARLYKFKQMDFEYALWQMVTIFVSPQKLYRNFSYHNSSRNQWARDDPAFLILIIPWLLVSSIVYAAVIRNGFVGWLKLFSWSIFIECIASGIVLSTFLWIITNQWMIEQEKVTAGTSASNRRRRFSGASDDNDSLGSDEAAHHHPTSPGVEWAYAFDIHLNAFFPCIIILRIILPMFLFVIRKPSIWTCLFGNCIWLAATLYYVYITFLGYNALPFLKHVRAILLVGTFFVVTYIVSVALGWNLSATIYKFYLSF